MDQLHADAIAYLEERFDSHIHYSSISPSVFLYLEIRDLSIIPRATGPNTSDTLSPGRPVITLDRVRLRYSLPRLLIGKDVGEALADVQIRNSAITISTDELKEILVWSRQHDSPRANFSISGHNVRIVLLDSDYRADFQDLFFRFRISPESYAAQIRRLRVQLWHTAIAEGHGPIEAHLRLSGRAHRDFSASDAVLKIDRLQTNRITFKRQALQIVHDPNGLEIRKIRDRAPLDLQLVTDYREVQLVIRSERYDPSALLSLKSDWSGLSRWFDARLTTDATFSYALDSGKLAYKVDLNAVMTGATAFKDVAVTAQLSGDEQRVRMHPLEVTSAEGSIYFSGDLLLTNFFPRGYLRLSNLRTYSDKSVDASLQLTREERSLSLRGERFALGDTVLRDLSLTIVPSIGSLQFDLETAVEGHRAALISATGVLDIRPEISLRVAGDLSNVPATVVLQLAPIGAARSEFLVERSGGTEVNGSVSLVTDFNTLSLSASEVQISRDPGQEIAFDITYDSTSGLEVSNMSLVWDGHVATLGAAVELTSPGVRFYAEAVIDGLPYRIDGDYSQGRVRFVGNNGLEGHIAIDRGRASFNLAVQDWPVPIGGPDDIPMTVVLHLSGYYTNSNRWEIRAAASHLRNLGRPGGQDNVIAFDFVADPRRVRIFQLSYTDSYGSAGIPQTQTLTIDDTLSGNIVLTGSDERYELDLNVGRRSGEFEVLATGFPLARIKEGMTGSVDTRLHYVGTYRDPKIDLTFTIARARLNTNPVDLTVDGSLEAGTVTLRALNASFGDKHLSETTGWYELRTRTFALESHFKRDNAVAPREADLKLTGRAGRSLFQELEAELVVANNRRAALVQAPWALTLTGAQGEIAFNGGPAGSIAGTLREGGDFSVSLSKPLPLRTIASGRVDGKLFVAELASLEVDMPLITTLVGNQAFAFTQGVARGKITLSGPTRDPDWSGRLSVSDARVSYFMSPDVTAPFTAQLTFAGKQMQVGRIDTTAGPTDLSAWGTLTMSQWSPAKIEFTFSTRESAGLHIAHDFGPVFVDGYAIGDVTISHDTTAFRVSGDLTVDYCRVTLSEPEEPIPPRPGAVPFFLDMHLTAARRVEFFWPSVTFPILRATARAGSGLVISYEGDTLETSVNGDVAFRGGEVFYINRSFYVKEGNLVFNESGDHFDPRLTLRGEIREQDELGEDIKIFLVVTDRRLSEFQPSFESEPPRSDVEIVSLLGGPIESQLAESGFAGSAVLLSSDLISHFGLLRPFEQSVREVLGLDLFSIRTRMVQSVVMSKVLGVQETAIVPGQPQDNFGQFFDDTTITLGKYIGKDLFFETLVRLSDAQDERGNIDAEILLTLEWPTPFFNLEWTMTPRFRDVDTFVRDNNQIRIEWRYLY